MADFLPGSGLEVPGLEAIMEYNGLRAGDRSALERLVVTSIGGLQDDPDVRDVREDNPDRDGDRLGIMRYGGRPISLEGKIRAGSIPALRDTWRRVKTAFDSSEHDALIHVPGEQDLLYNELPNPTAGVNVTDGGWGGTSVTVSQESVVVRPGTQGSFKLTSTAAGTGSLRGAVTQFAAKTGEAWSVAAFFRSAAILRQCRMSINWYDSTQTAIGGSVFGTQVTSATDHWVIATLENVIAPPGAAYGRVFAQFLGLAGAGEIHYVSGIVLNRGSSAIDYSDGDQPGSWWEGTPHNSRTVIGAFDVNVITNPNAYKSAVGLSNTSGTSGSMFPLAQAFDDDFADDDGRPGGFASAINASPTGATTISLAYTSSGASDMLFPVASGQWWVLRVRVKITTQFVNASGALQLAARYHDQSRALVSSVVIDAEGPLSSYPAGSIIDLVGVAQVPDGTTFHGFQVRATAQSGATGAAVIGMLAAFRVPSPSFPPPPYCDGGYRHCAWWGDDSVSASVRRRPRPFLLRGVRKTDRLSSPEKQDNLKVERDFLITARARDPRIYVSDERTIWGRLSGSPQYVNNYMTGWGSSTPPTGFTSIRFDTFISYGAYAPKQGGVAIYANNGSVISGAHLARAYYSAGGLTYLNPMVRMQTSRSNLFDSSSPEDMAARVEIILKRIDNNNYFGFRWYQITPGDPSTVRIGFFKVVAGTESIVGTEKAFSPDPGAYAASSWLFSYMNANFCYGAIFTEYPANVNDLPSPVWAGLNTTLAGADATQFGSGVAGSVGYGIGVGPPNDLVQVVGAPGYVPWIGRFEAASYPALVSPITILVPIIGDYEDVQPKLILAGDVSNPSISVDLPDGSKRQANFNGTFADTDPSTLDFDAASFFSSLGIDRWDTWLPASDFVSLQPGINRVSILASNWTTGKYHVGFALRDAYR